MATPEPQDSPHRTWIRDARRQVDEAERFALASGGIAAVAREPLLAADSFPGYELRHEIHRGAQGSVHLALQRSTGRHVALKLLHDHAFGGPLERARFERETRILATLQHPNIVAIHDGGSIGGRVYLVMDYIDGLPLDAHLAARPRTVRGTLALFVPICDAVNAAHLRGVIHRDLKPGNVRVDETGRPVVLDFGLAKFTASQPDASDGSGQPVNSITQTGQFLGSLPWAAPEQAEGSPNRVDTRTDVYALGVLLYQMLTGGFPYPVAGNMRTVLDNIATAEPIRPHRLRSAIDDEVDTILLKCLSKDRARRYQTAGDLAQDLRCYLAGEPIEAKRDSTLYVLRKTVRRYRVPLGVLAGFMLVLLAMSMVAWSLALRANEAAAAARIAEKLARDSDELARRSLRDSLIAQAHALRFTGKIGQRFQALEALAQAAAIAPGLDARDEAIAAMALPDLRLVRLLQQQGIGYFDAALERCAIVRPDDGVTVSAVADDAVIAEIPPPSRGVRELHGAALSGRFFVRVFDPLEGARRLEVWTLPEARLHLELGDMPNRSRFDISPDGTSLAVGRLDRAIHIYDLESGKETRRVALDRDPAYLSFDPTGRRLALYHAGYMEAQILELDSEQVLPAFESRQVAWSVAWHPDGRLLAGATGTRVEVWDPESKRTAGVLAGHEAQVVQVSFSHDGTMLLTYSWDGECVLWDARSLRPLLRCYVAMPAFSPDDHRIAGTAQVDGAMRPQLLELNRAPERGRLVGTGSIEVPAGGQPVFSRDGGLLLLGCASATPGARGLRAFETRTGREVTREFGDSIRGFAISPDDRFLFVGSERDVSRRSLQIEDGQIALAAPESVLNAAGASLSLSADARWALATGYSEHEFAMIDLLDDAGTRRYPLASGKGSASLSPDGRWAALGGWRGSGGQIWDLRRGAPVLDLPSAQAGVAFSSDGTRLAVSGAQGLALFEVGTWRCIRRVPAPPGALTLAPDGRLLALQTGASMIQLRDAESLTVLAHLEPPESYATWQCCFSPDSTRLAQATSRAGVVHLWDLRRIRAGLESLGLDWGQSDLAGESTGRTIPE